MTNQSTPKDVQEEREAFRWYALTQLSVHFCEHEPIPSPLLRDFKAWQAACAWQRAAQQPAQDGLKNEKTIADLLDLADDFAEEYAAHAESYFSCSRANPDAKRKALEEGLRAALSLAHTVPATQDGWISAKDWLPEDDSVVLGWIVDPKSIYGGYREIVCFGKFEYITDEDEKHLHGWHYERESEGDYDWLTFDMNGKVSHWQPLPAPLTKE